MRVSLNTIKKLVPAAARVDTGELVKLIGARLVEVEETIDFSKKYQGIYIVKVVQCEAIPETHLHLCQIDAGSAGKDFASSSESGQVQVVCGAPNVRAGMFAVWIAPGAIVPQTYGGENFQLDVRKLRGYESNGMLAGLDELDLGDDHSGIVEINPEQQIGARLIRPGDTLADAFELNDIILDIENKSLTHRPDCCGLIGFAREVAGILGVEFEEPTLHFGELVIDPCLGALQFSKYVDDAERVSITVDHTLCPYYSAAVFNIAATSLDSATEASNYLTSDAVFLAKAGMRTISKIVDATNVVMLLTGQPLHAFDYDKFRAVGGGGEPHICVRAAKPGEKLLLLDGKEIELLESDIVVCSGDTPVALAGAMGGESTEIDDSTKKIILESATVSLYNLRKTQMAHGIFSEAITRFTKGQPAAGTIPALALCAAQLLATPDKISDFEVSDNPKNPKTASVNAPKSEATIITLQLEDINNLLGTNDTKTQVIKTLKNVGIELANDSTTTATSTTDSAAKLSFRIPSWRTDLHIKEDLIEEVGRLLGYDNIPLDFPTRPFIGATKNPLLSFKSQIRDIMSGRLAAHELLTYSFVSRRLQESVGEDADDSYRIVNSISPELQCFRQSIIPSLLEKMRDNLKSGFRDFSLYEFNQVAKKSFGKDQDNVPILENHLAFVMTGDYYAAKSALMALLHDLGIKDIRFTPITAANSAASTGHSTPAAPYFEPRHSASCQIKTATNHEMAFTIGEIKQSIVKQLKISENVSAFELNLDQLLTAVPDHAETKVSLSRFPSVERDITLKVAESVNYSDITDAILSVFKATNLIINLSPISIFQKPDANTKNVSFHLRFASPEKTLAQAEISDIMEQVSAQAKRLVGAEIV